MTDLLQQTTRGSRALLDERLRLSTEAMHGAVSRGHAVQAADAFFFQTCRHIAAFCDVVLPAVRTQPAGRQSVKSYVRQARRLERQVSQAKHRVYGGSQVAHMSWTTVWDDLGAEFARLMDLEDLLVAELAARVGPQLAAEYAQRLATAELAGPSRPHPHSLHTGPLAHASRFAWARVDALWNAAEGRVVART